MTKEGLDSAAGREEIRGMNFNELYSQVVEVMGEPEAAGPPFYWRRGDWKTATASWAMLSDEGRDSSGKIRAHLSFGTREDEPEGLLVREERAFFGPVDEVAARGLPAFHTMLAHFALAQREEEK